jgi:methionyl-tRNA formyltransferase
VLSFHHGAPAGYRGRPAGFYELLEGADHLGVMVQRLSNRLDAGNVLAYGAVKVHPQTYRRTLDGAFASSTHLLDKAVRKGRTQHRAQP